MSEVSISCGEYKDLLSIQVKYTFLASMLEEAAIDLYEDGQLAFNTRLVSQALKAASPYYYRQAIARFEKEYQKDDE